MRLTVIHDMHGNITAVAASPSDSAVMYLATKPGQRMTEVEAPGLTPDKGVEQIRKHMADVIATHLVLTSPNEGKLKKKNALGTQKP